MGVHIILRQKMFDAYVGSVDSYTKMSFTCACTPHLPLIKPVIKNGERGCTPHKNSLQRIKLPLLLMHFSSSSPEGYFAPLTHLVWLRACQCSTNFSFEKICYEMCKCQNNASNLSKMLSMKALTGIMGRLLYKRAGRYSMCCEIFPIWQTIMA